MGIAKTIITGMGVTAGTPIALLATIRSGYEVPTTECDFDYTIEDKLAASAMTALFNSDGESYTATVEISEEELNCQIAQNFEKYEDDNIKYDGLWVELNKDELLINAGLTITYDSITYPTLTTIDFNLKGNDSRYEGQLDSVSLGNLVLPSNVISTIASNVGSQFFDVNVGEELEKNVESSGYGMLNFEKLIYSVSTDEESSSEVYSSELDKTLEESNIDDLSFEIKDGKIIVTISGTPKEDEALRTAKEVTDAISQNYVLANEIVDIIELTDAITEEQVDALENIIEACKDENKDVTNEDTLTLIAMFNDLSEEAQNAVDDYLQID